MMEFEEWVLRSLIKLLRANIDVATWAGTDTLGNVRVYSDWPPGLDVLGGTPNSFRYIRVSIVAGPAPEWDMAENKMVEVVVQVTAVDLSDGSQEHVLDAQAAVTAALEPPSTATLDGQGVAGWETRSIFADSAIRSMPGETPRAWIASRDWRVKGRAA